MRVKWHRPCTVRCPGGARPAFAHIGRAPDDLCLKFISYDSNGVRLIFYNAGRAPADVFIYRHRTAPVQYVTTPEKILKNRPVPGRLSNSPVMCTSLKSYDVSVICDRSIIEGNKELNWIEILQSNLIRTFCIKYCNKLKILDLFVVQIQIYIAFKGAIFACL